MRVSKNQFIIDISNNKIMRICNIRNILMKYNWRLNHLDNKAIVDFEMQNIEKY